MPLQMTFGSVRGATRPPARNELPAGGSEIRTLGPSRGSGARQQRPRTTACSSSMASVQEVDRDRIVEHPAHPGRCHCPAIGAAILVEPRGHFGMPLAEPAGRNTDPDADREASPRGVLLADSARLCALEPGLPLRYNLRLHRGRPGAS
jgi:hypothetical protein